MPAFDSQVRSGLHRGGFAGMKKTQFLLPGNTETSDWRKMVRLPFLLAECWHAHLRHISDGISQSNHISLIDEPGRFFDILLFMQSRPASPVLVRYQGPERWY
jgi:hypothetical protein